jgi:hypothetical protein
MPIAMARLASGSASMARTWRPDALSDRIRRDENEVFPTPPLPVIAIFILIPPVRFMIVNYRSAEDRLASCFIPRSNLHESTGSSRRPGGASLISSFCLAIFQLHWKSHKFPICAIAKVSGTKSVR